MVTQETEKLLLQSLKDNGVNIEIEQLLLVKKAMYQFVEDMEKYNNVKIRTTLDAKKAQTNLMEWFGKQPDFISAKSINNELYRISIKQLQVNLDRPDGVGIKNDNEFELNLAEIAKIINVDQADLKVIQGASIIKGGVLTMNVNIIKNVD